MSILACLSFQPHSSYFPPVKGRQSTTTPSSVLPPLPATTSTLPSLPASVLKIPCGTLPWRLLTLHTITCCFPTPKQPAKTPVRLPLLLWPVISPIVRQSTTPSRHDTKPRTQTPTTIKAAHFSFISASVYVCFRVICGQEPHKRLGSPGVVSHTLPARELCV